MRILITGEKSYIGTNFKNRILEQYDNYKIENISLKNEQWKKKDFSQFDVIFHLAAIVHQKNIDNDLYTKINKELSIKLAKKAKESGVKHFIFMSSLSVYGLEGEISRNTVISRDTPCKPNTPYGMSKLEAELNIWDLKDSNFKITIIRAPMVYGPNCPGNYSRLRMLARKTVFFPFINNKRSMIYIENLVEFIRLTLEYQVEGIFIPQNDEYVDTTEIVRLISYENGNSIYFSKFFGGGIKYISEKMRFRFFYKLFGNLIIDKSFSQLNVGNYNVVNFEASINCTEKNWTQKI